MDQYQIYENIQGGSTDNGNEYFCYIYMKEKLEAYLGLVAFGLVVLLIAYCVYQYCRSARILKGKNNVHMPNRVKMIYLLIFIWALHYVGKNIYIQVQFWNYVNSDHHQEDKDNESFASMSNYFYLIDFVSMWIYTQILILIEYNWCGNTILFFTAFQSVIQEADQQQKDKNIDVYTQKQQSDKNCSQVKMVGGRDNTNPEQNLTKKQEINQNKNYNSEKTRSEYHQNQCQIQKPRSNIDDIKRNMVRQIFYSSSTYYMQDVSRFQLDRQNNANNNDEIKQTMLASISKNPNLVEIATKNKHIKNQIRLEKFLKYYQWFRLVYFIPIITFFFINLFLQGQNRSTLVKVFGIICISISLFEAAFTLIILLAQIIMIKFNHRLLEIVDIKQINSMLSSYILLFFFLLVRHITQIYFNIYKIIKFYDEKCHINNGQNDLDIWEFIYYVIRRLITNFPIMFIIIRIYIIEQKNQATNSGIQNNPPQNNTQGNQIRYKQTERRQSTCGGCENNKNIDKEQDPGHQASSEEQNIYENKNKVKKNAILYCNQFRYDN